MREFTAEEAEGKVGKRIKARDDFSKVPAGSTGQVVGAWQGYRFGSDVEFADEWYVVVFYDDYQESAIFRKLDYERYVEELPMTE